MTQPTEPVTITLEAGQWNVVLGALHEIPYRLALPVIQALTRQFIAATEAPSIPARGNGEERPPV
jgi:hypothetical protein